MISATVPVQVRPSSSYHEHLAALNAKRIAAGAAPIAVEAADENLEDFDLAELVDVGAIPAIVMDDHKARLYARIFEHLTLHEDIAINSGGEIAWAMRKGSPALMAAVNGYQRTMKKGTLLGNILFKRWFGSVLSPGALQFGQSHGAASARHAQPVVQQFAGCAGAFSQHRAQYLQALDPGADRGFAPGPGRRRQAADAVMDLDRRQSPIDARFATCRSCWHR